MKPKTNKKQKQKVALAYTHGSTKTILVDKLVKEYSVLIYNPPNDSEEKEVMLLIDQLIITNNSPDIEQTNDIQEVLDFEPDVLVMVNLDIIPSLSDEDFYNTWFKEMKDRGNFVDVESTLLVFTQNHRGLVAATAFIAAQKVEDTDNVLVSSSIVYSSRQLFGDPPNVKDSVRAIPTGAGNFYLSGDSEETALIETLDTLRGKLGNDDISIIEAQSIVELIVEYTQTKSLDGREIVGVVPPKSIKTKFKLSDKVFTWLPTNSNYEKMFDAAMKSKIRDISSNLKKMKEDLDSEDEEE